jgi:hypothetical protein
MEGYNQSEEVAELLQVAKAQAEAMKENEEEHAEAGLLCNPVEAITSLDIQV